MDPHEQPTLADVAERAGVSVATASRVLTGARPVSDDLQRKVRDASRSLGYRRNTVASSLRLQRTETVGLVLPRYATSFLSALIESVSTELERHELSLVLRYSEPDALHDADNIVSLLDRRVDGIIVCPPSLEVSRESIQAAASVPVVQVGRFVDTDRSDSVGLDEDRATALLVTHLADRGATSIRAVGFDESVPADARRLQALGSAGAPLGVSLAAAPFTPAVLEGGIRAAERLLDEGALPRAIVCANDDVASGVLAVLRMRGVAVPGSVQVASMLDLSPGREDHSITTLRHPWPEMGREAVRLLVDAAARGSDDRIARRVSLAPQLVPGGSTLPSPVITPQEQSA
ncbi:LacI family transcriptional regulator [Herbiconiux moechotypicola]|uniref:LacI family DNA-binding transcriptional regulator n=1 Tax=Herbiconiux moechotypicola TaxID=637393 RepID=UPI00217EFE7E|nr:LacI family DNA-binding transcriptional regulator [Herbiconiux moechotypicola]MCS5728692.1 LacI family transcriptional regulator [Herbiconiux moechotypicola]